MEGNRTMVLWCWKQLIYQYQSQWLSKMWTKFISDSVFDNLQIKWEANNWRKTNKNKSLKEKQISKWILALREWDREWDRKEREREREEISRTERIINKVSMGGECFSDSLCLNPVIREENRTRWLEILSAPNFLEFVFWVFFFGGGEGYATIGPWWCVVINLVLSF